MGLMGSIPPDIVEEIPDSCVVGERKGSEFHLTLNLPFLNPANMGAKENTDNVDWGGEQGSLQDEIFAFKRQ